MLRLACLSVVALCVTTNAPRQFKSFNAPLGLGIHHHNIGREELALAHDSSAAMSHRSDKAGDMNDQDNCTNAFMFFSGKENTELANRLLVLHATIKNTPAALEHDYLAFDKSEALFMRDALVVEQVLASARTRIDASFLDRHPNVWHVNICMSNGAEMIARNVHGNVYKRGFYPLHRLFLSRLDILLNLCVVRLLWMAMSLVSS